MFLTKLPWTWRSFLCVFWLFMWWSLESVNWLGIVRNIHSSFVQMLQAKWAGMQKEQKKCCMVLNRILTAVFSSMQGSMGGLRFEASRALLGDLSQFNIWDRPLTRAELSALAHCSTGMLGNVVPWTSREVEVFGGLTKQSAEHCSRHTSVQ